MLKTAFIVPFIFSYSLTISSFAQKMYEYPTAPKDSTISHYFDTEVPDPYQWMENPNDPRLSEWLENQQKLTKKEEHRHTQVWVLRKQLWTMYAKTKEESTTEDNDKEDKNKYVFSYEYRRYDRPPDLLYKNKGLSNYRLLMKIQDFQKDKHDNVVVTNKTLNKEQSLIAIELSHNGSDWREVYFFNLLTGKQIEDTLHYLRAGSKVIWHEQGVYYDRYNKPKKGRALLDKAAGQALYYHKIGSLQSEDPMLFQNPDTTGTNAFQFGKLGDNKLIFHHFYSSRGKIYKALSYSTINNDHSFFLKSFLIYPNKSSINFSVEESIGDTVILKTNWNAPNGKVLIADINQVNQPVEIVPEYDITLRSVNKLGKNKIACIYRNNGSFMVLVFDIKGTLLKKIDFPEGKKVNYFYENDPEASYTDFSISSFYHPDLWYRLSLEDLTFKPSATVWVPFDAKDLETRYVYYASKDGTQIPMYITCLKDTKLNGKNPTLLWGYGGYGITIEPGFDESKALWLLHGGILAIPNVRGGGAEGSEWSKAGRRLNKQNTIDDFIAAAEFLIDKKYTSPDKLAITGGSHGGLLVGAAITQRPELFKAAVAEAGVYDMLRFENYTVGSVNTNINEFGTVSNAEDFSNMKSYSPLHNIKKGVKYPNTLLFTGDSDDRVPPFHSFKFLAALQEIGNPESLYLMYLIPGAGHGGALTPEEATNKLLFKYYFLFDQLGLKFW